MPEGFNLSSTDTITRSPALNSPSSQSALPRRAESCCNRSRTRSSTRGRRSLLQGLSPSRSLAVASSRIAGSAVLSAGNIQWIPRGRIGIVRQQDRMALGEVEDDRPCLEQGEIAFLIGRNLAERMKRQMRGFFHRLERKKTNVVRLAY